MQKKPLIILVILLVISILIFFNNNIPPVKFVVGFTENILKGPKAFLTDIRANEENESLEVEKLKEENEVLTNKLIEFERIRRDNVALRSQFEDGNTKEYELLPARVIGFLGKFSFPTSLIIDKGENDDIKPEMAVIYENRLVGKINKVSQNYSEISLISSLDFSGLARSSESSAPGIINGASDFVLFDRVDVNQQLRVGEFVITKGEVNGGGFGIPPDLIVGKIASINRTESLPFQTAKIESDVQFSRLDTVFVVLGI